MPLLTFKKLNMADFEIDPVRYGVLWNKVESMESELSEIRKDLKELLAMAERSKGSLWALMGVASVVGGIVSILAELFFNKK